MKPELKTKTQLMIFWSSIFVICILLNFFRLETSRTISAILVILYLFYRMSVAIWDVIVEVGL